MPLPLGAYLVEETPRISRVVRQVNAHRAGGALEAREREVFTGRGKRDSVGLFSRKSRWQRGSVRWPTGIASVQCAPGSVTEYVRESMVAMYVRTFGPEDGSPVLLLQRGGVAGWMWNSLRERLESKYKVLIPDLPGHGQSTDQQYRSHAETVDALSQMLRRGDSAPAAVVGFSLGAQLTIELASKYPKLIDRAMVVSAQAKVMPFAGLTLRALGVAAPLVRNRRFARLQTRELFVPPELMENYIDASAHITKATLLAAVEGNIRFELPAAWSRFRGQALVMVGRRERGLMRVSAAAIHDALPGSEIEVVDGCAHGIPLQRPDWFNGCVAAWLSRRR